MKYIITWTIGNTMYIQRYTNFFTARAAYMRLSFDTTVNEGWFDEYSADGKLLQNWFFSHNG